MATADGAQNLAMAFSQGAASGIITSQSWVPQEGPNLHSWGGRESFSALGSYIFRQISEAVERQADAAMMKAEEAMNINIAAESDGTEREREAEIEEAAAASELAVALAKFIAARDAHAAAGAAARARKRAWC